MSVLDNLDDFLTNIADAIRAKKGTTGNIDAQDFALEIQNLTVESTEPTTPTFDANTVIDNNLISRYKWIFELDTTLGVDGVDYASKFGVLCDDQYNAHLAGWGVDGTYSINGDTITFIFNMDQSSTWDFIVTYNRNTYTFDVNYNIAISSSDQMSGTCIMRPINSDDNVDNNFYKTTFKYALSDIYSFSLKFNKDDSTGTLTVEGSTETLIINITLIDGPFIYATIEGEPGIIFYDSGVPSIIFMAIPFGVSDDSVNHAAILKALVECNPIMILSTAYTESATKIGAYAFYCKPIYQATISKNITEIGEHAFADTALQSINFETDSELKSIGAYAFHNCSYLENGNADFTNCTKLEEFNGFGGMYLNNSQMVNILNKVPATIKSIGIHAFSDSSSLTQVDLSKFTELENLSGFDGCNNLLFSSIIMSTSKLKTIGKRAFYKSSYSSSSTENFPVLPNTITKIDDYAFGNRTFVTVDLSNLVNLEYLSGFYGCKAITNIILPTTNKITTIGSDAFENCTSLTSFVLPNTLTEIGSSAFYNTGLTEINIPDSVKTIGNNMAYNCKSLTKVTFSGNLTTTGQNACNGCTVLKDVTLKEGITKIDYYAFYKCSSLTDITLPNSITDIEGYAFADCSKLKNITLSNNLESINQHTFRNCVELNEITIPSTLTYIGSSAFSGCSNLTTMTILATTPPKLASSNSIPTTIGTIYIPAGTTSAYTAASNWSSYSSKFVELS